MLRRIYRLLKTVVPGLPKLKDSIIRLLEFLSIDNLKINFWLLRRKRKRLPLTGIYVSSKRDRYGANAIPWINSIALAKATNQTLLHNCNRNCYQFRDTLLHNCLLEFSDETSINVADQNSLDGWLYGQTEVLLEVTDGVPLPEYLERSGLKEALVKRYLEKAEQKGWALPFDRNAKSVAIHVRLGDVKQRSLGIKQMFIGKEKLIGLMRYLADEYTDHDQYLVTAPDLDDVRVCEELICASGIEGVKLIAHNDVDHDIYIMMFATILVLSRSTFCFIPALLHQGKEVFAYDRWKHLDELIGKFNPAKKQAERLMSKNIGILDDF